MILALGLGVVLVRRRSLAIALVERPVARARPAGARPRRASFLVAGLVLLVKAVALPGAAGRRAAAHARAAARRRRGRAARAARRDGGRGGARGRAAAAARAPATCTPSGSAVALVVVGLAIVVARRPALFQLLGLIVAENGLSLLALSVPGGLPYVIELGALFDLALVVVVASFFTRRIHGELGTGRHRAAARPA